MCGIFRGRGPSSSRELIGERTVAGLKAARARGRKGREEVRADESPRCGWPEVAMGVDLTYLGTQEECTSERTIPIAMLVSVTLP